MLTPQEVNEKVFPKASFGGYNMTAVDEFLDSLTEDYTALYKENAVLKSKMKILAEKVEEYRETEDAMRSTLLTAQKMATTMVREAEEKKREILSGAVAEAGKRAEQLDDQTRDAEKRLELARGSLSEFLHRSLEICQGQADFFTALPEMELPRPEAAVLPRDGGADVADIEKSILEGFAEPAEPAAEEAAHEEPAAEEPAAEPAAEEPAPAAETPAPAGDERDTRRFSVPRQSDAEENPFPTDFKMSLDELKFGRNYTGDNR